MFYIVFIHLVCIKHLWHKITCADLTLRNYSLIYPNVH